MANKLPDGKAAAVPRLPSVPAPESVPVIPLSDSPPPSRWKPGQKPWKPSYIHIQEIKAKVAPSSMSLSGQAADSSTDKPPNSVSPKRLHGEAESGQAHRAARRSHSRSSRSRSYSRSYSRSRSRSYSRSRSRSPYQYHSRSSSCSRSESENSPKPGKKNSLDKEWKQYYTSLRRVKSVDKYVATASGPDAQPGPENKAGSEQSPNVSGSTEKKEKGVSQDREAKSFTIKSEWDSDSDKVSQSNSAAQPRQQKQVQSREAPHRKPPAPTGWNSESDSENPAAKSLAISEKEEGEASSESEDETLRAASEAANKAAAAAAVVVPAPGQSGEHPEKIPEPEKHKSKKKAKRKHKHKRRSEAKSGSHHGKDKGKRSKRKHQKLKETFHWQPPLEFEEEEEEDESKQEKRSPGRVAKERPGAVDALKNSNSGRLNKNPSREDDRQQKVKQSEPVETSSRISPSIKEQKSGDDMDICTPEHEVLEAPGELDSHNGAPEVELKSSSKPADTSSREQASPPLKGQPSVTSTTNSGLAPDEPSSAASAVISFKWRPLKGSAALQGVNPPPVSLKAVQLQESQACSKQAVRMEIKSTSRVRPGSLFDEVRKTARLNQRPRNQESSSEERSPSEGAARAASRTRSPKKSRSVSRKSRSASSHRSRSRGWSHSYSRSRSRSRSSSYSSR